MPLVQHPRVHVDDLLAAVFALESLQKKVVLFARSETDLLIIQIRVVADSSRSGYRTCRQRAGAYSWMRWMRRRPLASATYVPGPNDGRCRRVAPIVMTPRRHFSKSVYVAPFLCDLVEHLVDGRHDPWVRDISGQGGHPV